MSGEPAAPPVGIAGGPAGAREHFGGPRVAIDDAFLAELASVCAAVETSPAATAEAGRDWWPISLRWALEGATPARPAAVARPARTSEVSDVVKRCNAASVPVTAVAGRSGVCGGTIPVFGGVSLDLSALSGVLAVDDESLLVDVAAGTAGPTLEDELRSAHGLTIGHWPQSIDLASVGGWIACRGAGQYSTRYGKIEDIVAGLEVVLANGDVVRTGAMAGAGPRSAMGPDLTQLFVGSEGTLGVITAARLRAHPVPPAERRAAAAFATFGTGLEALRRTLRRGATPAVLRLYDERESKRSFDVAGNVLIALDEGDERIVRAAMAVLEEECAAAGAEPLDDALVGSWLVRRNDVSVLGPVIEAGIVVDTIEISAPWSRLTSLYEDAIGALGSLEGCLAASVHESHAYPDGACLYFTFAGQAPDTPRRSADTEGAEPSEAGRARRDAWAEAFYRASWDAVLAATLAHGGSISHHHGIGLVRGEYLARALGGGYAVLAALKAALDPGGVMNPGKLGLPSRFGPSPWARAETSSAP